MYYQDQIEYMAWGYNEPIEQKRRGLHLLEKIGCNKLQIDEALYLDEQVKQKLAEELVDLIAEKLKEANLMDQLAKAMFQRILDDPDDPTITAIIDRFRASKSTRFDENE